MKDCLISQRDSLDSERLLLQVANKIQKYV